MQRDISKLTAQQLYDLALRKEREEQEKGREAAKAKVAELKVKKRELLAKHKKELSELERKITALTGRKSSTRKAGGRAGGTSAAIVKLLKSGEMDTKGIRAKLEANGHKVGNLAQTLAYLKRVGRIASTGRGRYKAK
jgi:hypothetical protein